MLLRRVRTKLSTTVPDGVASGFNMMSTGNSVRLCATRKVHGGAHLSGSGMRVEIFPMAGVPAAKSFGD